MKSKRRITGLEKRIVASKANWKCEICKEMLQSTYEIDHIIPLWKKGPDEISNLQALCRECHGKKTQIEEIERIRLQEAPKQREYICKICESVISPYFANHKCVRI